MNAEPEKMTPENMEPAADTAAPEVDSAAGKITALETALLDARDKMMRALAEADNVRKRAAKDREDAGKFAVSSFAKDLLDFSDNFHRALESIPADLKTLDPRLGAVMDGITAMERELIKTFGKHGIQKIEPLDMPFDPNLHEVMFEAPVPGKPGGLVIQVVETGYVLNGRLLRAAKVGISKGDIVTGEHLVDKSA